MRQKRFNCDTRYTKKILTIDETYVKSVITNCVRDNYRITFHDVLLSTYNKYESTCPLCYAGNKKKQRRPAVFIPTKVGYLFKCQACMPNEGAISFYNFLLKYNPKLAKKYQNDRWHKKLTGKGFNVSDPEHVKLQKMIAKEKREAIPFEERKAYYREQERKLKEKNKLEYQRRHGLID